MSLFAYQPKPNPFPAPTCVDMPRVQVDLASERVLIVDASNNVLVALPYRETFALNVKLSQAGSQLRNSVLPAEALESY